MTDDVEFEEDGSEEELEQEEQGTDDPKAEDAEPKPEDESQKPEVKAEADEEDEREAYSRRVNKRIDKLVYERNMARDALRDMQERLAALEEDRNRDSQDRQSRDFASRKQSLQQKKRDALEIGDYDEVLKIDDELFEIIADEKSKAKPQQQPNQPQYQQPQPQAPQAVVNRALEDWQLRNQWVFDQNQSARLAKANKTLEAMLGQGFDIEDPETYQELDKRLKREVPPPSAPPSRGQTQMSGRSSPQFTSEDRRNMQNWNLDPDNPEHRKEWLKNKARSA